MSRWLYPFERRRLFRARLAWLVAIALAFLVLLAFDGCAFIALYVGSEEQVHRLEGRDWYRAFRSIGTLWPWLLICSALALQGRRVKRVARDAGDRMINSAILILASAVASGLAAEVLQVLTGRLRPRDTGGAIRFRGLFERFTNSDGLGFPSSHTAVAFGAAFMVWFFWPAAGLVSLLGAGLCGLTRLMAGGHFLSDVLGAALVGYAMSRLMRPGSWRGAERGPYLP
jgi:membrane-associated phospholipid phosphatase